MRSLPPLLICAALAVSGCAAAAQGASENDGSLASAAPTAPPATGATTAAPPAGDSLAVSPAPSADPASVGPGTPALLTADPNAPTASAPRLPPNPFDLGGPAPVGSFVLGDSISLSAEVGPVLARLGYPVLGVVGQSVSDTYLRANLSSSPAQAAPAWVVELGTNNTADPSDVARLAGWVETIDQLRSPTMRQKVYWVTPHRPTSYVGSKSTWNMDGFNAELKRLDAEYPWLRVIDFDAVAVGHPEWFEQDTAMHLHPDSRGQGVLVALIAGPDAVPVEIPAPLLTAPASSTNGPEPQTFDNSTLPPSRPKPSRSPTPTTPEPTPESTPAPLEPATATPQAPSASPPAATPAASS